MLFFTACVAFFVVSWKRAGTQPELTDLLLSYRCPRIAASVAFKAHQLVLHLCLVGMGHFAKGDLTVDSMKFSDSVDPFVQIVYLCHACFQIQTSWFQPGAIHWVMALHHAVTIFLITASYTYGATQYGILVMFWHDLSDIPIYVVRSLRLWENLEDDKDRTNLTTSLGNFAACVAMYPLLLYSWIRCRVWNLGAMIWFALTTELTRSPDSATFSYCAIAALSCLWLMNMFWLEIMLRKVVLTFVAKLFPDQTVNDDGHDVRDSAP